MRAKRQPDSVYRKRLYDKRKAAGVCTKCSKAVQQRGHTFCARCKENLATITCENCWILKAAAQWLGNGALGPALYEKLEKQKFKCAYTREILRVGVNASVDHIDPRSRFPDKAHNIDNIQWVTKTVNRMKDRLTHDEFLALVKRIFNCHEQS